MIENRDIVLAKEALNKLKSNSVLLQNLTSEKLVKIVEEDLKFNVKIPSTSEINLIKNSRIYKEILTDAEELFRLGYGSKFISLCLSLKYKIFLSHGIFFRHLKEFKRLDYVFDEEIFKRSGVKLKGRLIYSPGPDAFYLTFKCRPLWRISKEKRVGIKIFFNKSLEKIFIKRDDRSNKKIIIHINDLFISLKPLPIELKKFLKSTNKLYKSKKIDIYLDPSDFGFKNYDFIFDSNAKKLFPYLNKYGFGLEISRTTNMDKSSGDLHIIFNKERYIIELSNIKIKFGSKYSKILTIRDRLIGKITRICLNNRPYKVIFVLNSSLKKGIINDDFNKVIDHFKTKVLFTDFENKWENSIARQIKSYLKS